MRDRLYSAILILAAAAIAVLVVNSLQASLRRIAAATPPPRGAKTGFVPPPPPSPPPPMPPPASSGAAATPVGSEVFHGRIVREDGKTPTTDASYKVTIPGVLSTDVWEATQNGEFTVGGLPTGRVRIAAMAPGYAELTQDFTLPQATDETAILVLSRPGPRVNVQVLSATGGGAADTAFTPSLTWRIGGDTRKEAPRLTTDGSGDFTLVGPRNATSLTIKLGYDCPPAKTDVGPGTATTSVKLLPYGSFAVRGSVVHADGRPGSRAEVSLEVAGGKEKARVEQCDTDGAYVFYDVPRGKLTLRALANSGGPSAPVELDYDGAADATAPRLKLGPGATLKVTVRGPARSLVDGVSVTASRQRSHDSAALPGRPYAAFVTAPNSSAVFVATDIAAGTWQVQAQGKGHQPATVQAQAQSGKTTSLTVTLRPLWRVSATVLSPEGAPLRGVEAVVTYSHTCGALGSEATGTLSASGGRYESIKTQRLRTDKSGSFTLRDLPPRGSSLSVTTIEGSGEVWELRKLVSETGAVDTKVRLRPPAALEGLLEPRGVRLHSRGVAVVLFRGNMPRYEPLQEGWDELGAERDDPLDHTRMVFEPKGLGFRFDNIVPADDKWALCVVAPNVVSVPVPVKLESGQVTSVRLPATGPGRIRGSVVDARGRPVPGAALTGWMLGAAGRWPLTFPRDAGTDDRGRFLIDDLAPGRWRVTCRKPGASGTAQVKVKPGRTGTARVKLSPQGDRAARKP